MHSNSLAVINIQAENRAKIRLSKSAVARLNDQFGMQAEMGQLTDGALVVVKSESDENLVQRAINALPSPCEENSFVWQNVKSIEQVESLIQAVLVYHSFNKRRLAISEAIGANEEFRRVIRTCEKPDDVLLRDYIAAEVAPVDRISSFREGISSFLERAEGVFLGGEWTIGSVLTLISAIEGFKSSKNIISKGWSLGQTPSDDVLDVIEVSRVELAQAARNIKGTHGVNLLSHSLETLSGLRRAVMDGGVDLCVALIPFGIANVSDEELSILASDIRRFLTSCDLISQALSENQYSNGHLSELMAHVLIRKYLITSAEVAGIAWADVAGVLRVRPDVDPGAIEGFFLELEHETFSAKLEGISADRGQLIKNVFEAADRYVFAKRYWIDAADRILEKHPDVTLGDVRSVIDLESDMKNALDEIRNAGAFSASDVKELERHLEWMFFVYALPVKTSKIMEIIESRGRGLEKNIGKLLT
jgi:hypothetical protein